MRHFLVFLMVTLWWANVDAQSVDYEIVGFVDGNDEVIFDMPMSSDADFEPRVKFKNNGPSVPTNGDTLYFDIYLNDNPWTSAYVLGSSLQTLVSGQSAYFSLPQPLLTAATMDEYVMTTFRVCFEARLVGSATDPNSSNNRACVQVERTLEIAETASVMAKVFPNPTSGECRIQLGAPVSGRCEVQVYDLFGKMLRAVPAAGDDLRVDMSALAQGLYLVRVVADGSVIATAKVVKE